MKTIFRFAALIVAMIVAISCGNNSSELKLSYEKYMLDNGLQVILRQDKTTPTVAVAIQYHVGSNREKLGATGFAHLFEHLLFQRSENLPRNAFFDKIDELGGTFNGSTSQDGTNYYEVVPRDALEKVLWMESDRMGFFINTVTEAGLRREIDIVSNEKRQGENQPYGQMSAVMLKYTYPEGHPYSWSVIGSLSDLESSTLDYVKEFYHTFYGPNNATIAISGDFDIDETKALVEKYFGEIKSGAPVEKRQPMPTVFTSSKGIYYTDPLVRLPALTVVIPTVERHHKDEAPLDILTYLLAGSKKSPLYRTIVSEGKLSPAVSMSNPAQELAGVIRISVQAFEGTDMNDVMTAIEKGYAMFEADPINEKDINIYVTRFERNIYNNLTSNLNVAMSMAGNNEFAGKPDHMIDELNAYRRVTKDDIMRVYNQYVKGKSYLTVSYLPLGQENLAVSGSTLATIEQEDVASQAMNSEGGMLVDDDYEFTHSRIERSIEPGLLSNTPVLPELSIWSDRLPNGLNVLGMNYNSLPLVSFMVTLKGGMLLDDIDKIGVASLNAQLMNEGTALRTAEQLEEDIDALGATISVSASNEYTIISGSALLRNFPEVLKIVQEMITQPRFDEEKFALRKERALASLRQAQMSPTSVGSTVAYTLLYGKDNLLGQQASGTIESISSITIDDLKAYYAKAISPMDAYFNFVGNISQSELMKQLAPLADSWSGDAVTIPAVNNTQKNYPSRLFFIDFPDSPQSFIYILKAVMPAVSPDNYPSVIANYGMGTSPSGELFRTLRLQYGYTYGASSSVMAAIYRNIFAANSNVQSTATMHSLELFREILTDYPDKILDEDKLERVRYTMLQANTRAYESPSQLVSVLNNISVFGLPFNYVKQNENTLRSITLQQVRNMYHQWLDEKDMIYVVTGDARRQMQGLESLGLGKPILVDRNGNLIND